MGFNAKTFASAEAFLEGATESRAECLVLEINFGGISGIELRRQLAVSGCELPTIFITAVDDESSHREATKAGCVAFLRKPFSAKVLVDAIDRATGVSSIAGFNRGCAGTTPAPAGAQPD